MIAPAPRSIRIGSRGSQLALWQANFVADALRRLGHEVAIEIIRTSGDRVSAERLQQEPAPPLPPLGKGIFTKEIEDALLAGAIDLAVHSLKDLPTEIAPAFSLAAIPVRADAADVLVSLRYASLDALPPRAVVGTGSPRRRAQLLRLRPDLNFAALRGNVDTRLRKLAVGEADALVLAAAGLDRLARTEWVRQRFSLEDLCPAPGQGALALECRAGDEETRSAVLPLEDAPTRNAVTAERCFLTAMGGGCEAPIGAYCRTLEGGELSLRAAVAFAENGRLLTGQMDGRDPLLLGQALASQLLARGREGRVSHSSDSSDSSGSLDGLPQTRSSTGSGR